MLTLPLCKSLSSLDLSGNELGGLSDIRKLSKCVQLSSLNLSGAKLNRVATIDLAAAIPSMKNLMHLNLANNQIDDAGIMAIGHVLSRCLRLVCLDLSENSITTRGAQGLVREVETVEHLHLQRLDLKDNQIDGLGIKSLSELKVIHKQLIITLEPQHPTHARALCASSRNSSSSMLKPRSRSPSPTSAVTSAREYACSRQLERSSSLRKPSPVRAFPANQKTSPVATPQTTRRSLQVPAPAQSVQRREAVQPVQPAPPNLLPHDRKGFSQAQHPMFRSPLRNEIHAGTSFDTNAPPTQQPQATSQFLDSPISAQISRRKATPIMHVHLNQVAPTSVANPGQCVDDRDVSGAHFAQDSVVSRFPRTASVANKMALLDKQPQLLVMEFFPNFDVEHLHLRRSALLSHIKAKVPEISQNLIRKIPRLTSRDIRKLDSTLVTLSELTIAVREHAIVFNIDPFRAVILHNRCLLVVPEGADEMLSIIVNRLTIPRPHLPHEKELPFEFRALETLFEAYVDQLSNDYTRTEVQALATLSSLRSIGVRPRDLELLRECKAGVVEILSKATAVFDAMTLLLEEDADMFFMQLTKLQANPALAESDDFEDHDEVETLLERFVRDVSRIRRQLNLLSKKIDNTEELLALKQSTASNTLLSVDLAQSLFLVCLAFAGCVGAVFGMNLNSFVQEDDGWFQWTIVATCLATVVFFGVGMLIFYKYDLLLH